MAPYLRNRITAVWAFLVGATVLSWALGHGMGFSDPRYAGVGIVVVAFVKVRFVFLDFMEVRRAPRTTRALVEAWIALVGAAVLGVYWLGSDPSPVVSWPDLPGL